MEEKKKYCAFISYCSEDEKWARWLQEKLEGYRLPAEICKKHPNLPRKLNPCFRYHTDIGIDVLRKELRNNLAKSQYLIVVCSPNSVRSEWVGEEIEIFIELGGKDRIIPFIIEGVPYSADENECLHLALKKQFPRFDSAKDSRELLGANVNEEGRESKKVKKRKALFKVIAKMQQLEFNELWRRHVGRLARRIVAYSLLIVFFVACFIYAYSINLPIDVSFKVKEISAHNENLPPMRDAALTFYLGKDKIHQSVMNIDDELVIPEVPSSLLGKEVRVVFECDDFLSLDTILVLNRAQEIGIRRNDSVYGNIELTLYQDEPRQALPNVQVCVDGRICRTNDQGVLKCFVPLFEQRTKYEIKCEHYMNDSIGPTYNRVGQSKTLIKY